MSELISKQAAIDAVMDEFKRIPTNAIRAKIRIEALPPAQPEPNLDEWCDSCKEYDKEKHSCPRWNKVIKNTVDELKSAQPEQCDDAVKSHSEKDILNMCISLLDEMVGYFGEYMEWIGYEPTKEEKVCGYFGMTYFHIVKKLFLYHTTHSGGTSTFKKCHELGIDDPSDGVRFPLWKEEEGDAE